MPKKSIAKFIRRHGETLAYLFFWVMVYATPVLMMYLRTQNHTDLEFEWDEICHLWLLASVFFVLFIVHNFFLAPLLVYKNRRSLYFPIVSVIIIVYGIFQFTMRPTRPRHKHHNFRTEIRQPAQYDKTGMGPYKKGTRDIQPTQPFQMEPPRGPHHRPFFVDQFDFISVIILILMFGMNLGIKLFFKQEEDEKKLQQLRAENLNQQLTYLKYQINPHFFMNTLNNIHALVDIDPEKAKESIIELSKLMRYVLYDGNMRMSSLQKENDFIANYIELMRLRYSDKVDIRVDTDSSFPDAMIASLITVTYVENAFKHGISYNLNSFIHITAHVSDGRFLFTCRNSKHKESTEEHGGVGLENTRKRLNLIYGEDYTLNIEDTEDAYNVELDIPLNIVSGTSENEKIQN